MSMQNTVSSTTRGLQSRILQVARYFEASDFPLTLGEMQRLLGARGPVLHEPARGLLERRLLKKEGNYFYLPGSRWTVEKRIAEHTCFQRAKARISASAWFLSHLPFVRGVLLSGRAARGALRHGEA
ncbi:MAG: hypothetical protein ACYC5N_00925, partial [Endomicrobiales bacterium]